MTIKDKENFCIQAPLLDTRAAVKSVDSEKRTFDVIVSTGSRGLRGYWEPYFEELEISRKAVRMDRAKNKSVAFLKNHDASIENQIGVVEKMKIEEGQLIATIRMSKNEKHNDIFRDIQDGILRNISVGYRVYRYDELEEKQDDIRVLRATDWEPMEVSLVAIPFDGGAVVRSQEDCEKNKCEVFTTRRDVNLKEKEQMTIKEEQPEKVEDKIVTAPAIDQDKVRGEGIEAEQKRSAAILGSVEKAGLELVFARKLIEGKVSIEDAREQIIDELAKRGDKTEIQTPQKVEVVREEKVTLREGMTGAILHRGNPELFKVDENSKRFASMSLLDMARKYAGGYEASLELSKSEVVRRAFHSTSDFPNLLLDAANKSLQKEYTQKEQSFEPFVRRTSLSDFKLKNTIRLGDAPALELKNETGEIKKGTISEGKETYKLATYAKGVMISRETIINDDLDALVRVPGMFGRRAKEKEGDLVYAILTSNPTMSDGDTLFHANHGNLGTAGAIAETAVTEADAGMRLQTGLDGLLVHIEPLAFVVPVALKVVAEKFVSVNMLAATSATINPFAGKLKVIADPRLDAASSTVWYMVASKDQVDMIELGTLDGQGPMFNMEETFATGVKFEVAYDIGVGLIDHRGFYKNPYSG